MKRGACVIAFRAAPTTDQDVRSGRRVVSLGPLSDAKVDVVSRRIRRSTADQSEAQRRNTQPRDREVPRVVAAIARQTDAQSTPRSLLSWERAARPPLRLPAPAGERPRSSPCRHADGDSVLRYSRHAARHTIGQRVAGGPYRQASDMRHGETGPAEHA